MALSKRGFSRYRHYRITSRQLQPATTKPSVLPKTLADQLSVIENSCSECGACVKSCAFLRHYGTPKSIALGRDFSQARSQMMAYECTLCSLCTAVCPEKLDPCNLFLTLRRFFVENGHLDESFYRTILGYEKRGRSKLFSWQGMPDGCDTVFFPGCNLPGSRMTTTLRLYDSLCRAIPNLGIVLNCCNKPSHDLGRQDEFTAAFEGLRQMLEQQGVKRILVACPNCYKTFHQYGKGLTVQTVYEVLEAKQALVPLAERWDTVSVHDPCAIRNNNETQNAVRRLIVGLGLEQVEMRHRNQRTICCGEGGTVGAVRPLFAKAWTNLRDKERGGRQLVTYCAGCCDILERAMPTVHIADLLFRPKAVRQGRRLITRSPFTYLQRLRFKKRVQKKLAPNCRRTSSSR